MDASAIGPGSQPPAATLARARGGFGTPLPRWAKIFMASVMLTTAMAALVTHDLLVRWEVQARLQVDATRMAVAGAVFLPGAPARATLAAAHSAELHGLRSSEVVHADAASDRMSFNVTLTRAAPVLLLWLLGAAGTSVTVQATATVHSYTPSRRTRDPMVLSWMVLSRRSARPRRGGMLLARNRGGRRLSQAPKVKD